MLLSPNRYKAFEDQFCQTVKTVKLGFRMGLSKEEIMGITNEAVVDEIMGITNEAVVDEIIKIIDEAVVDEIMET